MAAHPCAARGHLKNSAFQMTADKLLKKPSLAFPTSPTEKRDFQWARIVFWLKAKKTMAARPCAARSLSKNSAFQKTADKLLKKPSLAFPTSPTEKRDFQLARIFFRLEAKRKWRHVPQRGRLHGETLNLSHHFFWPDSWQ